MAGTTRALSRVGGTLALTLFLVGCAEEPKPAESTGTGSDAAGYPAEEGSRQPILDDVPAEPPVQSEPQSATNVAPKPVTPEELQAMIGRSQGKIVLVDFWATWCAPCVAQFPHTVELSKTHATDLVVLAVSMDETDEATQNEVAKFYTEHASGNVQPLINATSGDEDPYAAFEITNGALPHYKLYGRDGELIQAFGGDVDNPFSPEDLDKAIATAIGE